MAANHAIYMIGGGLLRSAFMEVSSVYGVLAALPIHEISFTFLIGPTHVRMVPSTRSIDI